LTYDFTVYGSYRARCVDVNEDRPILSTAKHSLRSLNFQPRRPTNSA